MRQAPLELLRRSGVEFAHQAALATSGLLGVNRALGGGFVETLDGKAKGFLIFWCACCLKSVFDS